MRGSWSYERLGSIAYAYVVVVDAAFPPVRQTGHVKGDFTIHLWAPDGSDLAGSVSITCVEYGSTGAYRFSAALPSGGDQGNYCLTVTDPQGRIHTTNWMAYVTLQGDTGDNTAQLELWIRDLDGTGKSGVVLGDMTVRIYTPSMVDRYAYVSPTLTELEAGHYLLEFDSSEETGDWFVDAIHTTYFPAGQSGSWRYYSASVEVSSAPNLNGAVNDGSGSSATLTYVAADAADTIYTYYRLWPDGSAWTLSGDTRVGSGDVQITGLSDGQCYEFMGVASKSGSAIINQSPPSVTRRVFVTSGATLFGSIQDALWEWADSQTAESVTTIWMPANAPMPAVPFVTLRMRPLRDIGHDHRGALSSEGIATIYSDREFILEVEVYGDIHPDGTDEALSAIETIKRSLQVPSTVDTLQGAGIAPRGAGPTQDLSAIGRTHFEARYLFEATFGLSLEASVDLGLISTVEAPTATYQ